MSDLAKQLVAAQAENVALRQGLAQVAQAGAQRSQIVFSMWAEAISQIADAANAGDPQAKQICRQVSDVLGLVRSAGSGITLPPGR